MKRGKEFKARFYSSGLKLLICFLLKEKKGLSVIKNAFLLITIFTSLFFLLGNYAIGEEQFILMATTTSTDNTGLLDYLAPVFKNDTGIELRWVSIGTGKALELGKNCDVDVLLVHAPEAEEEFILKGYGVNRCKVMYNDFVIVGREKDPAKLKGLSVKDAFKKLAERKYKFVSRGDDSGTHKRELYLWKSSSIPVPDRERWYLQSGQGMLVTLNLATEQKAYTLTDRGTYIIYRANYSGKVPLVIIVEGDEVLRNQYSVIAVNPKNCEGRTKYKLALEFIRWITSREVQELIGKYEMKGAKLFIPNAE